MDKNLNDIAKLVLELRDNLGEIENLLIQERSVLSDLLYSIKLNIEVTNGLLSKFIDDQHRWD